MHGTPDERESAASGIGELIDLTSPEGLKAFYVKITGPLIRIMADKFPWHVKAAILRTLATIITRGGAALKPFQPQLQTTFVKALQDPTQGVRGHAAGALGKLMAISTRVDPLVNELVAGVAGSSGGIQESILQALTFVLSLAGDKVTPPMRSKALEALEPLLGDSDKDTRWLAGGALGSALRHAGTASDAPDAGAVASVLYRLCLAASESDEGGSAIAVDGDKDGRCAAVKGALKYGAPGCAPHAGLLAGHVSKAASNAHVEIRVWAARSAGFFLAACDVPEAPAEGTPDAAFPLPAAAAEAYRAAAGPVVSTLVRLLGDDNKDVVRAALEAARRFGRSAPRFATSPGPASALTSAIAAITTKDFGPTVRSGADQALIQLLQLHGPAALASQALANVPGEEGRWLATYAPRFLVKMAVEEDDGDEDQASR